MTGDGKPMSMGWKPRLRKMCIRDRYVDGRAVMNPYNNLLDRGKSVTIKADAGEEFRFVGWRSDTGDIVSTDPEYTITLDQDTSLERCV